MIKENIISATLINDIHGNQTMVKVVTNDNQYWIPLDPANINYQEYLEWVAEGNTPEEAE